MSDQQSVQVLLEKSSQSLPAEPYKVRVLESGEVQTWSTSEYVIASDGSSHFEQKEPKWRMEKQLSAEDVSRLKAAITDNGFFELHKQYEPRDSGVKDGAQIIWTARLNGKTHRVTVLAAQNAAPPELERLDAALTMAMQEN